LFWGEGAGGRGNQEAGKVHKKEKKKISERSPLQDTWGKKNEKKREWPMDEKKISKGRRGRSRKGGGHFRRNEKKNAFLSIKIRRKGKEKEKKRAG